jgi:hypothetical protein
MLWFATARTLLKDSQCMQFCRKTLTAIMQKPECLEVVDVGGSRCVHRLRNGAVGFMRIMLQWRRNTLFLV